MSGSEEWISVKMRLQTPHTVTIPLCVPWRWHKSSAGSEAAGAKYANMRLYCRTPAYYCRTETGEFVKSDGLDLEERDGTRLNVNGRARSLLVV